MLLVQPIATVVGRVEECVFGLWYSRKAAALGRLDACTDLRSARWAFDVWLSSWNFACTSPTTRRPATLRRCNPPWRHFRSSFVAPTEGSHRFAQGEANVLRTP